MTRTKAQNNVIPLSAEASQNTQSEKSQSLPVCPSCLNEAAQTHFDFLVAELSTENLVTSVDLVPLVILANAYAGMQSALLQMQAEGEFQITRNGYAQLSPWTVQYDRYSKQYEKLCVKLGITAFGRKRLNTEVSGQEPLEL